MFRCYFTFIIVWICCLTVMFTAQAQVPLHFTTISSRDGLSSNTVNSILKDRYGLIWFATEDGLTKFDGTDYTVYRHNVNDSTSLRSSDIASLYEDKSGRLWIGTGGGGLHLYNRGRNTFEHFNTEGKFTGGASSNIRSIYSDYKGKLWVGTLGGLLIFDPATKTFSRSGKLRVFSTEIAHEPILSVYEDSHRQMWIGTKAGLFKYNRGNGTFLSFMHQAQDVFSLAGGNVKAITEDANNNLWIGTNGGISKLLPDGNRFQNITDRGGKRLSSNMIYTIARAGKNLLWVGTEEGLNIVNTLTGDVQYYQPDGRSSFSLSGKSVRSILIDKQGISWIGTYVAGVSKYDSNLTFFSLKRSNPYDPYGLSSRFVTSFAQGNGGNVFVGTDGGGLNLYNPKSGLFSHYKLIPEDRPNKSGLNILALTRTKDGNVWAGTFQDGLFRLDPKTGVFRQFRAGGGTSTVNHNDIFCLEEDRDGKLWVGSNGGGVSIYNPQDNTFRFLVTNPRQRNESNSFLNGYIRDFEEDRYGRMWIASHGTGIAIMGPESGQVRVFSRSRGNLPSDKINVLFEDSHGSMWAGSGDGLIRIDEQTYQTKVYGEADGLADGVIHKLLEDKFGRIWFSTNKGISWLNPKNGKVTNYSTFNGLQGGTFEQGSGFVDNNGILYFGGIDGFNFLDPGTIRVNHNIPPVQFTDLKIDGKPVTSADADVLEDDIAVAEQVQLSYKENFAISYVGLNFTSPKQNRYYYRLTGFDKNWVYAGNKTTAYYTNLSPGEYVFEVRACNNDGVWNMKGKSIKVSIRPPFWMTFYAYIFYFAAVCFVLLYLRYRGIKRLRQEFKQTEARRESERLRELDAMKIKFLTNLSHDFRTPISLIMAPVDKLLGELTEESSRMQLRVVKRNSRRLLNLVNQIFDFRRIEERELKLNLVNEDIIAFIKDVSESFQDLSEKKRIAFVFKASLNQLYTDFDPDKLERTLFNLLSNAFKFTMEGGKVMVLVFVKTDGADADKHRLIIEVSDTGIGIEPNQQQYIFNRFYQDRISESVFNPGSGIGLSIVKEFVQLHGGNIELESVVGKGSTFRIELPATSSVSVLSPPEQPSEVQHEAAHTEDVLPGTPEPAEQEAETKPLILIIEDNEDFRYYLKDNLKDQYRVLEAVDGREGWQKALSGHPELIVSDIMMPNIDGIELSIKLKSDKRTSHIPVILLTASTREEEQIKGLSSGANDYLTKPFSFEILHIKVKNLLSYNRTVKNTFIRQVKITGSEIKVESANEKFLKTVVNYIEDNLTNTQLSVEDLSRHVGISRGSLYNKLLETTGLSPVEFIRTLKLEKAVTLLEKSDLNVAQIAYTVGFATPNYFARSFKAKYNMLPSEYMNQKRKPVRPLLE